MSLYKVGVLGVCFPEIPQADAIVARIHGAGLERMVVATGELLGSDSTTMPGRLCLHVKLDDPEGFLARGAVGNHYTFLPTDDLAARHGPPGDALRAHGHRARLLLEEGRPMPYVDADRPASARRRVPKPFRARAQGRDVTGDPPRCRGVHFAVLDTGSGRGRTDYHAHDVSGELMVLVSGRGAAWLAGEEHELKPGVAMYAPPGVEHRTMNTGRRAARDRLRLRAACSRGLRGEDDSRSLGGRRCAKRDMRNRGSVPAA